MNPLLVSVLSAPERHETRDETIQQLQAATGVKPAVSLSNCSDANAALIDAEASRYEQAGHRVWTTGDPTLGYCGKNNSDGARAPVMTAVEEGYDLLYCEDDLELADDFPWFLAEARAVEDAATYLYTHDFRSDKQLGKRYGTRLWARLKQAARNERPFTPKGLYRIQDANHTNSGQCIYLPHAVLTQLPLQELKPTKSAFDTWIQHRLMKFRVPVLVALPHPVQHRHVRMGRPVNPRHKTKFSMSFDLR